MKIIDPGHVYELESIDGSQDNKLVFVKRVGEIYPGNMNAHAGTTMQEVLRALIDRASYVNHQTPCLETQNAIALMSKALWLFESRAARRHNREVNFTIEEAVKGSNKCSKCGHVNCELEHRD